MKELLGRSNERRTLRRQQRLHGQDESLLRSFAGENPETELSEGEESWTLHGPQLDTKDMISLMCSLSGNCRQISSGHYPHGAGDTGEEQSLVIGTPRRYGRRTTT